MNQPYFAILTEIGEAKHQNAAVLGVKVNYATMAVGDGNGAVPTPDRKQRKLVNQIRREAINRASIDPENPSQIIVEQVIPEGDGGWWIREAGVFDDVGDLIAVASLPPTYKPQMAEGSGRTQVIRIVLLLSNASVVSLKIDPAVVLATRQDVLTVQTALTQHIDAGDPHPQYAPKASPALTGKPTAPTASAATKTTQLATTAFVHAVVALLVDSSPASLDTLKKLAQALGNDPNFATTMQDLLAKKADKTDATTSVKGVTAYATDVEAVSRASKTKALTPYGLGQNVQSSPNDSTDGKLLAVGMAFGLGSIGAGSSYDKFPSDSVNNDGVPSGLYWANSSVADLPEGFGSGLIIHRQIGSTGAQILINGSSGVMFYRGRANSVWQVWKMSLAVGDYGLGSTAGFPPGGRDSFNPTGFYYLSGAAPAHGGGQFFFDMQYSSTRGAMRLSTDPYTDRFYLQGWFPTNDTWRNACELWHTKNFDPNSKANKTPASQSALGLIKIATTALAQGLTNDTDALTPKKLADVFLKRSLTQNSWYQVFPGGLIVQGGYVKDFSNYTITLPTAFPNGVLGQPIACAIGSEAAAPAAAAFPETSVVIGSQFKIFTYTPPSAAGGPWGTGPRAVAWLAFGY